MYQYYLKYLKSIVLPGLLIYSCSLTALEFEPGIGLGFEYTDNATLAPVNELDDLIAIGYVGFNLIETGGPVEADISAALNHQRYTKDTFDDQRYFNLNLITGWEMIEDRFDWILQNFYNQRPIDTLDPNTPDNVQDTNIFTFGADMRYPVSPRQELTLNPDYRRFYYEVLNTDNQQYSLDGSWDFQISRMSNVGLGGGMRRVDYDIDVITDVTFGNLYLFWSARRALSDFSINLGTTYVKRDNGQSTNEMTGNLSWNATPSKFSDIRIYAASGLTDSSNTGLTASLDPDSGDQNNIQVTADVIRNKIVTIGYTRLGARTSIDINGELREVNYSESPNDRKIRGIGAGYNYTISPLTTSTLFARYTHIDLIESSRTQNRYTVGGSIGYRLSRKLRSEFDLKYRKQISTLEIENYSEWTVFASLVYGYGSVMRPTRAAGFL